MKRKRRRQLQLMFQSHKTHKFPAKTETKLVDALAALLKTAAMEQVAKAGGDDE